MMKCIIEISKWILDKSFIKFHIIPTIIEEIHISNGLIHVDIDECLPLTKSHCSPKMMSLFYDVIDGVYEEYNDIVKLETLLNKSHQIQISLTIDTSNFSTAVYTPVAVSEIASLPTDLNKISKSIIPVIGFYDNFSVICIQKGNKCEYEFSKAWNGLYGKELIVSFCNGKPVFFHDTLALLKPIETKMDDEASTPAIISRHLVYDILKILSMPKDSILVKDHWKFELTKDKEHPVIIQFEDQNGQKLLSTPEFLMALFIKKHKKIIKAEIGEKPEQLGFCILDKTYNSQEMERIKEGLEESCKLLKTGFLFFDI